MNSGTLAPPAKNRITRELSQLSTDPPPGISCYAPDDNLTYLHSTIIGPPDSPFASGIFLVTIHIPNRYPFEPPKCRFVTPIHHPNIDSAGRICLDTLKAQPSGSWSPAVSLPSLLLSLRALMAEPNAEDGLVADVTEQFKSQPQSWFMEAKRLTELEATDKKLIQNEQHIIEKRIANGPKDDVNQTRITYPRARSFVRRQRNTSSICTTVSGCGGGKENQENVNSSGSTVLTGTIGKRKDSEANAMNGDDRELKFRRSH